VLILLRDRITLESIILQAALSAVAHQAAPLSAAALDMKTKIIRTVAPS